MSLLLFSSKSGIPRAGLLHGWDLRFPNLCRWSEDWSQALWTKSAVTATSGAADPQGGTLGYTLAATASGGSGVLIIITAQTSTTYTLTLYASPGTSNTIEIGLYDQTAAAFFAKTSFNVLTGVVITTTAGSATITASTNGFYKITVTGATTTNTDTRIIIYPGTISNVIGNSCIVWGAQVNEGSTPTTYVKTDALQSIPNLNTANVALTFGATSGVEASDPVRTNNGSMFNGTASSCQATLTAPGNTDPCTVVIVSNETKDRGAKGSNQPLHTLAIFATSSPSGLYITSNNNFTTPEITGSLMRSLTMVDATLETAFQYTNVTKVSPSINVANETRATVSTFKAGCRGTDFFLGRISYVLIYNRALPEKEVRQLYTALKVLLPHLRQQNLLLQSEDLTQSSIWSAAGNITVNSATQVTVSLTASSALFQTLTVLPSTNYIFSFDAKLGTLAVPKYSVFDMTHTADIVASTDYSSQIAAGGWSRVTVPFTTPAGCVSVRIYPERDGTTTGTLSINRLQLTLADRAYSTTTSAVIL